MKKLLKWAAVATVVLVASLAVIYRAVNRVPSETLSPEERVAVIFDDGGCVSCHSENPKLPFYAELPVMGKVVKQDVDSGYRAFDITAMNEAMKNGTAVHPVDLAKVEKVVLDGRMPMAKYYLVHWGSSLTSGKVISCGCIRNEKARKNGSTLPFHLFLITINITIKTDKASIPPARSIPGVSGARVTL